VPLYELTQEADADILAIARYTISNWGIGQALRLSAAGKTFTGHRAAKARSRVFINQRPELIVSRVEHHYVFHQVRTNQCPLILAVLHENMDLISRIRDRLDP
jgi:toxin ParE1/3/4